MHAIQIETLLNLLSLIGLLLAEWQVSELRNMPRLPKIRLTSLNTLPDNKKRRLMTEHSLDGLADLRTKMKMTFRIQKNRQNGQSITFVADDKHPNICPVRAAYRIFLRAKRLGQSVTSQWSSLPITRAS
jgi:hypothetical protein